WRPGRRDRARWCRCAERPASPRVRGRPGTRAPFGHHGTPGAAGSPAAAPGRPTERTLMSRTTAAAPPAPDAAAAPAESWEELVTTALLGTDRRTPPGSAPGTGAPVVLLDAAAAATVRRRAGLRPARAAERPRPAPEDPRPPLPAAAARRLAVLLTDRPGG